MAGKATMIWREGDRCYGAVASDEGIEVLIWSADKSKVEQEIPKVDEVNVGAAARRNLERLGRELHEYHTGKRKQFTVKAAPQGTEFQKTVWEALCGIPYGKSMLYGELARQIGRPTASRAVGAAVGKNPVWLIIPCHRLLGSSGKLTGFAGGLDEKRRLLNLEGIEWKE